MSNSLHIAKKHEVKYADISSFKNKEIEFERLMYYLDIECEGNFPENFEIHKEDWRGGIDILKKRKGKRHDDALANILKNLELPLSQLIKLMENFLKQSDPNNDYMILSFF